MKSSINLAGLFLLQNGRLCCSYTSSCRIDAPSVPSVVTPSSGAFNVSRASAPEKDLNLEDHLPLGSIKRYIDSFLDIGDNFDDNFLEPNYESDDSSSSSHEFGLSDKKMSPLSGHRTKEKQYQTVQENTGESDHSKEDFIGDWSHELATK